MPVPLKRKKFSAEPAPPAARPVKKKSTPAPKVKKLRESNGSYSWHFRAMTILHLLEQDDIEFAERETVWLFAEADVSLRYDQLVKMLAERFKGTPELTKLQAMQRLYETKHRALYTSPGARLDDALLPPPTRVLPYPPAAGYTGRRKPKGSSIVADEHVTGNIAQDAKLAGTEATGYVQPSRAGKKGMLVYVDPEVAEAFKRVAAVNGMGSQELLGRLVAETVAMNESPAQRDKLINARVKRFRAEVLAAFGKK